MIKNNNFAEEKKLPKVFCCKYTLVEIWSNVLKRNQLQNSKFIISLAQSRVDYGDSSYSKCEVL